MSNGDAKAHPSGLHPGTLSAHVLDFIGEQKLGLQELAAACDVIAAECRFNLWVGGEVKQAGLNEAGWLELLERIEAAEQHPRKAMQEFAADRHSNTLLGVFAEVAARLNDRSLLPTTT